MQKLKILIACHEGDGPAELVIDRLANVLPEKIGQPFVWRGKAACQFARVETVGDNDHPVLLKGLADLDLGSFELSERCAHREGIFIITRGSKNMPLGMALLPPRNYFRGLRLGEREAISGLRKIILLNSVHGRSQYYPKEMVRQAATAIMMCLEREAVESMVFSEPGTERPPRRQALSTGV